MRAYDELFAIIKKNNDDDIFMNALIKNVCRIIRVRKKIEQWRCVRDIIVIINYVAYYRANVVNAKMQQFQNFLIQFEKKAKTVKWRFDFIEVENEKLFNIFEIKRVKIENEFLEKIIDISIKITKKSKWKKIETKNDVDVVTTIENKYKMKSFINHLMIAII